MNAEKYSNSKRSSKSLWFCDCNGTVRNWNDASTKAQAGNKMTSLDRIIGNCFIKKRVVRNPAKMCC
ncbi:MAG: hypothetical protein GF411_13515 [Candidatus Lokiarchaeota archaeon]|nr:hypothetical protein [Candidatus Lokiarchaeota archaeon]